MTPPDGLGDVGPKLRGRHGTVADHPHAFRDAKVGGRGRPSSGRTRESGLSGPIPLTLQMVNPQLYSA